MRGDIFELIPASGEFIYQIEIKDQKIERLSAIDPISRKIKYRLKELVIFPLKHFISTEPEREKSH